MENKKIFGYSKEYYITEKGKLYEVDTNREVKRYGNTYKLKDKDNKPKSVSLKTLYRIAYKKEFSIDSIEDLDGEEWKEIENTNGIYFVSNKGRIKSYKQYNASLLIPKDFKGYKRVQIYYRYLIDGKEVVIRKDERIHKLVAKYFIQFVPQENIEYCIHHIDKNRENNDVNNLCYIDTVKHRIIHNNQRKEEKNYVQ